MQDPLFGNKIASALLAAALLFFGLPQLANAVFGGGHHSAGHELHFAYAPEFKLDGGAGAAPAAVADLGTLLAGASADAGKRRIALCASCHTFEKAGANLQGPNLWAVVGRPVASHEGFTYTSAMKAHGGAWTYERLYDYIHTPQKTVPGTAMSFAGIAKAEQRAEVLAYLRTLSDQPVDFPAPAAPAEPAGDHAADPAAPAMEKEPG
ncbi:MAG: cytochrome c family protein [Parvularculaceae bacterium]